MAESAFTRGSTRDTQRTQGATDDRARPTTRLTVAQALVRFLAAQYTERDGVRRRLIDPTRGIFGHGNVAGLGQALLEYADDMPYHQGRSEQAMVHAAVGFARQGGRLSAQAVTTSVGGLSEKVGGERFATTYRHRTEDSTYTGRPLPVDLAANAASLGMRVLRAKTVDDLRTALAEARAADTPTCVYVETETADTVSGAPPAQAWWDVPVAETPTRPPAVRARELYERPAATRRRHL